MTTDDARQRLGDLVAARRKKLGLSKEAAARLANISSITWKRVEDGKGVQDAKYASVSSALGWAPEAIEDYLAGGREPVEAPAVEEFAISAPDPVVERMLDAVKAEHPDWLYRWAAQVLAERRSNDAATRRNSS